MQAQPPFRADQVGSLLRPAALAQLRARFKQGEVDAGTLRKAEDDAVREAVQKQEAIGLQAVTDGEFRRDWWHLDFLSQLDGVTLKHNEGEKFKIAGQEQPPIASVTGRVGCSRPIMVEDFKFLRASDEAQREDDDPVAVDAAFARRARIDRQGGVPRPRCVLVRRGGGIPPGDRRTSPTPAAATCNSTT